ncbi:aminopeptidase [Leptolyngbya sp. 'hensonii']|uniref:aminopeptidase P family protein n=1 Tax=Leptolyngbya sp. 'hensonii' TaxID=1922337 RepID=UPI00094FE200|nr:aminopeptidase P family protein [Leptolyngbya sp. 'hensonii']OLP19487.1 aminopeptidase [Leptolyngbya sp. 'hensonii']
MTSLDLLHHKTLSPAARLDALRLLLADYGLDGYLVPSADEHLNEYVPQAKQRRDWLSGFTGSAGEFLVAQDQAWLFVDSRYHEQADLQVESSLIQVSKLGLEGQKTLEEMLESLGQAADAAGRMFRLGFDPFTLAMGHYQDLERKLKLAGVDLVPVAENLVDRVRQQSPWAEMETLPPYGESAIFSVPDELAGESVGEKLRRVRAALQKARAQILPVTRLDQISWLFNLRGWDIPYNPVFIAYAIVTPDQGFLFTNLERVNADIAADLSKQVNLLPYDRYAETLVTLVARPGQRVLLDGRHTTRGTQALLLTVPGIQIVEATHPIEGLKARKNKTEIEQMQAANLKASRAKTRTLKWLSEQLALGNPLSEADVAATIEQFYAAEPGFQGLSFNTIAAAGANSSIVHYGTPNSQRWLESREFLLLDSGCQFMGGTTDDTRTTIVGEPTPEQIKCYTEVLKAHINCAMQRFPKGTTGSQLDGIARSDLWRAGLDYGHGTGHGVGAFLNVHEGPNGISKRVNEPLEPGMVTSIEPGYYRADWGGIRIENLYVVRDLTPEAMALSDPAAIKWYGFEPLTYVPFERQLIDLSCLDSRQQEWLKNYNEMVVEKLSPELDSSEITWLEVACKI